MIERSVLYEIHNKRPGLYCIIHNHYYRMFFHQHSFLCTFYNANLCYIYNYRLIWHKKSLCFCKSLLGAIGLPVFSGFRGGVGNLLGVTGGYLIGFLLTCLISGFLLSFFKKQKKANVVTFCISMALGLIVCYAFGTAWYIVLYTNSTGSVSITSVLSLCVFPFLLPDALKMGLSYYVIKVAKKPLSKLLL